MKKFISKFLATVFAVTALMTLLALTACGGKAEIIDVQLLYGPDKDLYVVGETFDATGLQITAVYSDGTREPITDYEIDKTGPLTLEDTVITITCGEYTFEQPITVCKPGDVIVMQFTQGVDGMTLYADGGVLVGGVARATPTSRTKGVSWSWDGKEVEILVNPGNFSCQPKEYEMKDGMQKLTLHYDAQNNITVNYVYIMWTISAVCPYSVWSVALDGKTFPIAQDE